MQLAHGKTEERAQRMGLEELSTSPDRLDPTGLICVSPRPLLGERPS